MRPIDGDALKIALDTFATITGFRGLYDRGQVMECIDAAPTVATDTNVLGKWISVKDRLPEEKKSMFAKSHATEKWSRAMWQKESETVLVGVAFPDGGQKVTVGRLHDGKWSTTVSQVIPHTVTHWMPMPPDPPKEETP